MTDVRRQAPWLADDADLAVLGPPLPAFGIRPVSYDLLVVGAGIVGCTVALDAVRRGMSVALIEAGPSAGGGV